MLRKTTPICTIPEPSKCSTLPHSCAEPRLRSMDELVQVNLVKRVLIRSLFETLFHSKIFKVIMFILYGSETGNAQDVAEMLAAYMKLAVSSDSCALPMDCFTLEELSKQDLVLFVCSTTGVISRRLQHPSSSHVQCTAKAIQPPAK